MFPIKSGDAYIKENGERSTLGAMISEGGGSDLPEYSISDAGKILSVDNEGDLQWETPSGSELPEYSSADAGKSLQVDNEGALQWASIAGGMKVYYKDFTNIGAGTDHVIAAISDGTTSDSGIHINRLGTEITVNGYTPIQATGIDVSTGYYFGILFDFFISAGVARYYLTMALGNRVISNSTLRARVYYVKNEDVVSLT